MSRFVAYGVAALMIAATPFSVSAATQIAGSGQTELCGPDAPEGYKRPGGYCETLDDWKSLAPQLGECPPVQLTDAGFVYDEQLGRLRVAIPLYDPCCQIVGLNTTQLPVDGVLVATSGCNPI